MSKVGDLTILFLTLNRVPERWAEYHKGVLLKAIEGYPLITISRVPMDFGTNLIQTEPPHITNIYRQMMRGAKLATTPYIGIAEDDTLYPPEHFSCFRPRLDEFGYNMHRWWLHTWDEPVYSAKRTLINSTMIAPRELLIEAIEERFAKYPNLDHPDIGGELGKDSCELRMGVTPRKVKEFYSKNLGVVQFDHDYFNGGNHTPEEIARRHTKRPKPVKAIEIPFWGRAEDLRKKFV